MTGSPPGHIPAGLVFDEMEILTVLLISIGLAMDALAVSLGIGTSDQIPTRRGKIRLAAHFGIAFLGVPVLISVIIIGGGGVPAVAGRAVDRQQAGADVRQAHGGPG